MLFDIFDDDDGIIDDEADGQHHSEQGQGIDGEIESRKGRKGADDGDRDGQNRYQRRPPFLQEYEDDEDDQQQRFDEGVFNFIDGGIDKVRIVHDDGVVQVGWEGFLGLFQNLFDFTDRVQSIGIIRQLDAEANPVFIVDFGIAAFILRARLDIGHVFQIDKLAV